MKIIISDATDEFRVAAGKKKLKYDSFENLQEQKFEIHRIHYDPEYIDADGNYAADIVIIVLKTLIQYSKNIAPICLPHGKLEDNVIPYGWKG